MPCFVVTVVDKDVQSVGRLPKQFKEKSKMIGHEASKYQQMGVATTTIF
jgi:hypothetical protein